MTHVHRKPISMSLGDLVQYVEDGKIISPEMIQRGFVWGKNRVYDLFESVFRSYPIGIIILWEIDEELKEK